MTAWSEENFLERLIPRLRQKAESTAGPCPDSESLAAFAENHGSKAFREAITIHLVSCARCREIEERLQYFARTEAPEDGLECKNAEKRLDNWMGAFLRAQASRAQAERAFSTVQPAIRRGWLSSWRLQWALGTLAFVAVAATTTFFLGFRFGRTQQRQVAVTLAPPPAQRTAAPPAVTSESGSAVPSGGLPVSRTVTKPQGESRGANSRPAVMTRAPAGESEQSQPATNPPAGAAPVPEARPGSSENTATPSPALQANAGAAAAPEAGSHPYSSATGAVVAAASKTKAPVEGLASFSRPASTQLPAAPALRPATKGLANYPASIRLPAGTRVWIQLKSVNRQADGSLTFQGSLHLPVTKANRVLLERGTEVKGFGTESHGRMALSMSEFVIHGVHYALKSAPSSEGAVTFEGGRVLETFLGSDSTYEKASETTGQP